MSTLPPSVARARREHDRVPPAFNVLHLFFGFSRRIPRLQFWVGVLTAAVIDTVVDYFAHPKGVAIYVITVVLVWSGLAVLAKRWHDRDRTGWWVLLLLVPVVGALWTLIELGFFKGTPGANRFGPPSV